MSTITINFNNPDSPPVFGQGVIQITLGGVVMLMYQNNTTGNGYQQFLYEGFEGTAHFLNARNFVQSFTRDYRNVGGSGNLSATSIGGVVTITSLVGDFSNPSYNGDGMDISFSIENDVVIPKFESIVNRTNTGDCSNITYEVSLSGGVSPYRVERSGTIILDNWDGLLDTIQLTRGVLSSLKFYDSGGNQLSENIFPTKNILPSEFSVEQKQFIGYSDLLILNTSPINGIGQILYSLDETGSATGLNYSISNAISRVNPGNYNLFIRDGFGCEILKPITVSELQDTTINDGARIFNVMKGNSLIMSECKEYSANIKKSPENTISYNELTGVRYQIAQEYDNTDIEPIQFKSSYPFHIGTLHTCSGQKIEVPTIMISQNLGLLEKVDCKLFPYQGGAAVYFDGGNQYSPDTTNIVGSSPYNTLPPDWIEEGQLVFFDAFGGFEITGQGFDVDRNKAFFTIDLVVSSEIEGLVQVSYNVQDYNTFHAYINFSLFDSAIFVLEKGYSDSELDGNPWVSERLSVIEDSDDLLLIEWTSTRNKAGIVFSSGEEIPVIEYKKRKTGILRSTWEGESEVFDTDSRLYGLSHTSFERYRVEIDFLTAREVNQLNIATGLDGFKVNNVKCQRITYPEINPLGDSNFYSWKATLGYSGNDLAEQNEEIVFNPTTGNIGSGSTGNVLSDPPIFDGRKRLSVDGRFVTIDGDFITVD